jgi:SET domain-containing protein
MNHSDKEVNCEYKKDVVACLRDIEAGEELLVDYGPDYHFKGSLRFEYTVKEDKQGAVEQASAVQESLSELG